ncbi:MAG: hypothetical protein QOJ07_321 [Thermoleophilaceae bacterium]|nr:hypothetical protein [Thermoleophilaceae bacterium]
MRDGVAMPSPGAVRGPDPTLPERFRRHAASLEHGGRSPLCIALMRGAADDIEAGGPVARLFDGVATPPGSVPALRLLAALHHLVLSGDAPELATFYPSAGGARPPAGVWPAALAALEAGHDRVAGRLTRTVQTNDPGRASVLYAALLWLTERHGLPIRLLEIGASAGLNLHADRYCQVVDGAELGDPASPLRFDEPWRRAPDLRDAARRLRVVERAGCDLAPLDPGDPGDRMTLLSYLWPDEPERIDRMSAALAVAARDPAPVTAAPAGSWLPGILAATGEPALTVVWHSLLRQYVDPAEWTALEAAFAQAPRDRGPVVWVSMEPTDDHLRNVALTVRESPDGAERRLARCGDHGPPVVWD